MTCPRARCLALGPFPSRIVQIWTDINGGKRSDCAAEIGAECHVTAFIGVQTPILPL